MSLFVNSLRSLVQCYPWSSYSSHISQSYRTIILLVFISLISVVVECNPAGPTSEKGGGGGGHRAERDRAIENSLTRITTRIENMLIRVEQLDNRLQRLQSLVSTRLDGVENSLASSKLRMDIISEEVSRVDENLSRRWKTFESKIESNINSLDSKYESKLNLLLREGRRYGDGIFNGVDKKVGSIVGQIVSFNNSVSEIRDLCNSTLIKVQAIESNSSPIQQQHNNHLSQSVSSAGSHLMSSKVTNMFEVLMESSTKIEAILRNSVVISNSTRLEFQDNFRTLLNSLGSPSSAFASSANQRRSSSSHYGSPSSEVTTAMAILETLASTESMSTTISRRITDLARSIEERFEMVSVTVNGFSESCHRIQLNTPLLEEHIADTLDKMLNTIENRSSTTDLQHIMDKLVSMETKCEDMDLIGGEGGATGSEDFATSQQNGIGPIGLPGSSTGKTTSTSVYDDELIRSTSHLPEDEKKLLWEAFFPSRQYNSSLPQVLDD